MNWYSPVSLTVNVRSIFRSSLATTTVAFLTTAPFGSFTVTCSSAVAAPCAQPYAANITSTADDSNNLIIRFVIGISFRPAREIRDHGAIEPCSQQRDAA